MCLKYVGLKSSVYYTQRDGSGKYLLSSDISTCKAQQICDKKGRFTPTATMMAAISKFW